MNPLQERYPDLLEERHDAAMTRCVAALDDIGDALMKPARRHAAFTRVLDTWSREQREMRATQRRRSLLLRRRVAPALAVLALVTSAAGYLHMQSPTPVSAAQVTLARAAVARHAIPPDQAAHAIYSVTTTAGAGYTAPATYDVWAQQDANGAIARGTFTVLNTDGSVQSRAAFTHDVATIYNAPANNVVTATVDHAGLPLPLDTAALARLAQGAAQDARLLPPRQLDGADVAVVEIDRALPAPTSDATTAPHLAITLYIDAQTSVVRGMDYATVDAAGATQNASALRLTTYEVVPASSAPENAFALNAPATARIVAAMPRSPMGTIHRLTVSQAIALPHSSALLLAGQPDQLHDVLTARAQGDTVVEFLYGQPGARVLTSVFAVYIVTPQTGAVQRKDLLMRWPAGTGRPLVLTVAGQQVRATFYEPVATTHIALYIHNGVGVRITGTGMSRTAFFEHVRALVDGRTHPTVVMRAQRELVTAGVTK